MKYFYQNLRLFDSQILKIPNLYDKHRYNNYDLKDYVDISYEVNCDGQVVQSEILELKESIPVREEAKFTFNLQVPERGKCYYTKNG